MRARRSASLIGLALVAMLASESEPVSATACPAARGAPGTASNGRAPATRSNARRESVIDRESGRMWWVAPLVAKLRKWLPTTALLWFPQQRHRADRHRLGAGLDRRFVVDPEDRRMVRRRVRKV